MICRTKEIEIPKDYPFENCKLHREPYATTLTKVVSQFNEGGVLSICGEWGTGKTTFVKMWEQQLKNSNFHTLYFNVWEHDFMSDPLIGIITQFRNLVPDEGAKQTLATISKSFLTIVSGMAPKIAKGVASHCIGEDAAEALEAGIEKASKSFDSILDEYEKQSNSIIEFRNCLAQYVKFVSSYNPIIFIVDELDRCNPTYAVKTLERIKHLFNIPGIVFVLSIDKSQLCNSIRGYFGSEQLNAEEYLKRFIDFEYHLPFPSVKDYCNYLYGLYGFGEFFKSEKRLRNRNIKHETSDFLTMSELLFHNMNFNLRQIEKQFIHLRIALLSFSEISYVHPGVVVLLEYFRHKHIDFYNKLHHKEYTIDELVAKLEEILPHNIISQPEASQDFHFFVWEVAKLICCYVQDNVHFRRTYKLISDGDEPDLCFETKRFNRKELLSMIRHNAGNELSYGIVDIRILIDHIELIYDLAVN